MTTLWGLHMPEDIGGDALEQGYVAIGWSELGELSPLPNEREAVKAALTSVYPDKKAGGIPVEAGVIIRFLHVMKEGDYIVYPSKHDRQVNIGKVAGPVTYHPGVEDEPNDYPNRRKVDWVRSFPRSDFSQSALYEIGSFLTLFLVKNHKMEFLAKIDPSFTPVPSEDEAPTPDDDSVTSNVSRQAVETTQDYVIRKIYNGLNGYEFEHFVAHLLHCMGYTARVSEKSGDGGVDVIAHTDELGFEPPIIPRGREKVGVVTFPDARLRTTATERIKIKRVNSDLKLHTHQMVTTTRKLFLKELTKISLCQRLAKQKMKLRLRPISRPKAIWPI